MIAHHAFPHVTLEAIASELAREKRYRARVYPLQVAKGRMLEADASREMALLAAWKADCARIRWAWLDRWRHPASEPPATAHTFTWAERRQGLLRELRLRARVYPRWIASGRMLEAQARQQIACLDCLLSIYEDGWDWRGSDDCLPSQSKTAAREYRQVMAEADARRGTAQQELAL